MGKASTIHRICLIPKVSGVGGMVTFLGMLTNGLVERGIGFTYDLSDGSCETVLVIGGTRDLTGLWRAKRRGVRIVQRLDGMNWIHRKRRTGFRHYLRAEYGNFILSIIRSHLADQVIYQSEFSRTWWERVYGITRTPWRVVYNGVDLEIYTPVGVGKVPKDHVRVLIVEGSIGGGYEWGLETAIRMAEFLSKAHAHRIEVQVAGRITGGSPDFWASKSRVPLTFVGQVPHEQIPELDRSAHVLYAADINAACPNSVLEAMGCGLPVVAFDTGALSELVMGEAGILVPYGGNPWNLDPPNIEGLAEAANTIINGQQGFRAGARKRAEHAFGAACMVEGYLQAMVP